MKKISLAPPLKTPLVFHNGTCIKIEGEQRSGSVKYRMVYSKVCEAMRVGQIQESTVLVEVSAGSTGVALAEVGFQLGLEVEIHVHETAHPSKVSKMESLGARVVRHPVTRQVPDLLKILNKKTEEGGHWHLNQMEYEPQSIYTDFSKEIIEQILEIGLTEMKYFICPVGTGGLIQGVGQHLKQAFKDLEIISLEPKPGVSIDGIRNTKEQSMGPADPYDRSWPDASYQVERPEMNEVVQNYSLGESASATLRLIEEKGWKSCLMVAADG